MYRVFRGMQHSSFKQNMVLYQLTWKELHETLAMLQASFSSCVCYGTIYWKPKSQKSTETSQKDKQIWRECWDWG